MIKESWVWRTTHSRKNFEYKFCRETLKKYILENMPTCTEQFVRLKKKKKNVSTSAACAMQWSSTSISKCAILGGSLEGISSLTLSEAPCFVPKWRKNILLMTDLAFVASTMFRTSTQCGEFCMELKTKPGGRCLLKFAVSYLCSLLSPSDLLQEWGSTC